MLIALRHRLAVAVPTAIVVSIVVFLMIHFIPGDPIGVLLSRQPDPVVRAALEHHYGLDLPLPQQYLRWISDVLRGDLGRSIQSGVPVSDLVFGRLPHTLYLIAAGLLISLAIAIPGGVLAASGAGTARDHGITAFSLVLMSLPEFWAGTLLVILLGVGLGVLPTSGYVEPWTDPVEFARHLIMPALAVGAGIAGLTMRTLRSSLIEALRHDYVLLAESQGASRRRVLWVHAMRNAMIPTVTLVGLQIGLLLGGAIVTERVFSYPGLGLLLVSAISSRDYPVIQGSVLVLAVVFIILNVFVDLLVTYLEPRERRPSAVVAR